MKTPVIPRIKNKNAAPEPFPAPNTPCSKVPDCCDIINGSNTLSTIIPPKKYPMGIVKNIYDKTPTLIMKNTVATITAVFTSIDAAGNSVIVTGDDIHDELITRSDSYLINGVYQVGALVFDKDGCLGVLTKVDPDDNDNTDDYQVEKLYYGGNF